MKMRSMDDLYLHVLRNALYAENQLAKTLPKLAKQAHDATLRKTITGHVLETKVHAERLEQVFKQLALPPRGEKSLAIDGLIEETLLFAAQGAPAPVADMALLALGRRIKHAEIGTYKILIEIAKMLGHTPHVAIFKELLKEERAADLHLSFLLNTLQSQPLLQDTRA